MTVLFVVAHPDDEAYGVAGTIAKLSSKEQVVILSVCNGNRPGADDQVGSLRRIAFSKACKILNVGSMLRHNSDLSLDYKKAVEEVERAVNKIKPHTIYTHNISDINTDHRYLAEACLVASRPKPNSCVYNLYFFEVPSSTDWTFHQVQPSFQPNVYEDITNQWEKKKQVLSLYTTETYEFPDARSIKAAETLAKYRGYQCGVPYAEAFQLVFSRRRRSEETHTS